MRNWIGILVLLLGVSIAQGAPEFVPAQERAQGHSLTAANVLNDSLYSNPAGSSFVQAYSVNAEFLKPKAFSVSILDTKSSNLGGAVGYFRQPSGVADNMLQGAKLALFGRISDVLGVGVAGKTLWDSGRGTNMKDLDAGLLVRTDVINFGLTMRNLFGGNAILGQDEEWSFGTRFDYQQTVFISAATVSRWRRFKPYQYGVGIEYVSPYYFGLKGGYRFQPDDSKSYWGAGVSFVAPRISLHYVFESPVHQGDLTEHMLGVTLLF